jgi:hypothetical protein
MDPGLGRANEYAADGGRGIEDVRATISAVAARTAILPASFTAYNPNLVPDRRFRATAIEVLATVVAAAVPGAAEPSR